MTVIQIVAATTADDYTLARELFREYAAGLGVDLCFQSFDEELTHLSEMYGPPDGTLLLAHDAASGEVSGCVGLRQLDDATGEMKRLYVRPTFRGTGLGRQLTVAVLNAAREAGYTRVRLDTLPNMRAAQGLYASLGFVEIAPYYENPIPGARYLEMAL